MGQLKIIAQNITKHSFDYPFYCSRKLDIDEKQQKRSDQHSIRFEHFDGVTVLAFSGNYYGAYAADKFSEELRARQTFLSVVLPIAQASVPLLQNNPQVQGYAIEISHHVIGRTMGMPVERAENMMVYLPRNAAIKLVAATDKQSQQAALLESKIFLNANPLNIWLTDDGQPPPNEVARTQPVALTLMPTVPSRSDVAEAKALPPSTHHRSRSHASRSKATSRDSTSRTNSISHTGDKRHTGARLSTAHRPRRWRLSSLRFKASATTLVKELEPDAHFIVYAPPAFIAFRHQAYLELSVSTVLPEGAGASRYKLAALWR
jgi:hypothetical protein